MAGTRAVKDILAGGGGEQPQTTMPGADSAILNHLYRLEENSALVVLFLQGEGAIEGETIDRDHPGLCKVSIEFEGRGLENPVRLEPHISYKVPSDRRAQFIYGRIGNPNPELVYLLLTRNQKPMRYLPVGAQAGMNISLSAIQDILARLRAGNPHWRTRRA